MLLNYEPLLRKMTSRRKTESAYDLVAAMRSLQSCEIAFHLSMADIADPWHVMVWSRHLDASGVSWYVIAREENHHKSLVSMGVKSVFAGSAAHLNVAIGTNVRAVIYANNALKNIEMMNKAPHLTHIQLLHGDSDKPPSFRQVTRCFDEIWVSGGLGKDRYALNDIKVPDYAFRYVGRPQVADRTIGSRCKEWREKPVIGYMPTWVGGQGDTLLSSCDRAADIIRGIRAASADAMILFKPHPFVDKDPNWPRYKGEIDAAVRDTGCEWVDALTDATRIYEQSDVLVTDISSTMSDYLWSRRPLVVIAPHGFNKNMRKSYPSIGGSYLVQSDLSDLQANLDDALSIDSLADKRNNMREYVYGIDDGRPADARFIDEIRRVAGL